ncbi:MAG: sulfide/dihydroorotate dehydrogenase-like FAD/NAD-binding protein [Candidatus Omnitrophota bacterium]|nr:sulfide/dihydroorotate dehydrogenase-like FAD/NAD-binding protein [Candidatus Omnitrophota bacterium]
MKILSKASLIDSELAKVGSVEVVSPEIASKVMPGQFVVIMVSEKGERVPLTIVDKDIVKGTIKLIFQEAGLTTKMLGAMKTGDSLYSLVGPLGHPTQIKKYGKVIIVGGGIGIAEIYPVAKAMKEACNYVTIILGARSKYLLILEDELRKASDELYVATDDGSYGRKGFTTDILEELLDKGKYDLIYSVGPIPMMKRSAAVTKKFNVKTIVSLNAIMVDATGMCGCCRITVGGKTYFSCVDGPEFDASLVDWEELAKRNKIYDDKEKHICRLDTLQR